MERDELIASILPELNIERKGSKSIEEEFMHQTLRPILKFQHDIIISLLNGEEHLNIELLQGKNTSEEEKRQYITSYLQKNNKLKQVLLGTVIGLFSIVEMEVYLPMRKKVDKRIVEMIITRYLSECDS